ncbi:MAG: ABC transporter ATP-binding protein [Deltaproteobacteria bacterium]|nr:ABC transporter ATP-binding protein [Deltaproteobacteria bacterium]
MELIRIEGLYKSYGDKAKRVEALRGIDLQISKGEMVAVVGASGAGKSTLLHLMGTLDKPTKGDVFYKGERIFEQTDKKLALFRNKNIGFVFQFHHLLPEFTAIENVMMPVLIGGGNKIAARKLAERLLSDVGLEQRLNHKPGELSGGEQQRVAIARALVHSPDVLLADEPTGNVDTHTGDDIFHLLLKLNKDQDITMIIVTHNERLANRMKRRLRMVDGKLYEETSREAAGVYKEGDAGEGSGVSG